MAKLNSSKKFTFEKTVAWLLSEFIINADSKGDYVYHNPKFDNIENLVWLQKKGCFETFVDETDFDSEGFVYRIKNLDVAECKRVIKDDLHEVRTYKTYELWVQKLAKMTKAEKRTSMTANDIERKAIDDLRRANDEKYYQLKDKSYSI